MIHSISGWMRGVQVKLSDPLRMRAISECLKGVFTTWRYTNPSLLYLFRACVHDHTLNFYNKPIVGILLSLQFLCSQGLRQND